MARAPREKVSFGSIGGGAYWMLPTFLFFPSTEPRRKRMTKKTSTQPRTQTISPPLALECTVPPPYV